MNNYRFTAIIFILGAMLALINCKQDKKQSFDIPIANKSELYTEGLALLTTNCVSCHSPENISEGKIAPSLLALKESYANTKLSETEFVEGMTAFLTKPTIENSRMPKSIEKYGLMPNLGMSKKQYDAVGTYLYYAEIDKNDWFEEVYLKEKEELLNKEENLSEDYLAKGMNIALATKAILGKNLLTAIQSKGSNHAIEFCNERAIFLTDSMSASLNAEVKRVSDKNRNPNNLANQLELAYIKKAKLQIEKNGKASPEIQEIDNKMVGYYPIMTNNMCLQCHGDTKTDIDIETFNSINKLYPEDQAIAYSENELRGIWVIKMDK